MQDHASRTRRQEDVFTHGTSPKRKAGTRMIRVPAKACPN
ncbi:hypothetical protein APS_0849 [Acetobacter pasteurianus subsp. pasteurianus LMG 1262 = NBRC 106471]|nr:hypothetical protein APS_0849 [Acetobacter pasteurianus subsp. pasteurianus LMG 1262 = NBRC 106471]